MLQILSTDRSQFTYISQDIRFAEGVGGGEKGSCQNH